MSAESIADTPADVAPEASAPVDGQIDNAAPANQSQNDSNNIWDNAKEASKPEWFMSDKYKSVEDQARAAFELQKKMGKNWGAPDDYKLDGIEGFAPDDPILTNLKPALKELGLSQEGFSHLVKSYQNAQLELGKQLENQLKQELSSDDAQTIRTVDKWLTDAFSPEDKRTIQSWIVNAKDFHLLNTMRAMMPTSTNVPSSTLGTQTKFESTREVENDKIKYRQEVNKGIRVKDKNFEDGLKQRWTDAFKREEQSKSIAKK